ncbi:MAG TPA: cupin domain-containing protein [Chloroflexota bacterium]|nr:cupin domain-containing protein [Chloroflexota bacterium]
MRQLATHAYAWSHSLPRHRLAAHGHFVQAAPGEAGVLIDPVPFGEGDEAQVRELGGVTAVLVLRPERAQRGAAYRDLFGCPLLAPQGLGVPGGLGAVEPFPPGASLPGGLRVVAAGAPAGEVAPPGWPAVVALYHGPSGAGILGGAVAGDPAGSLSLTADESPPAGGGTAQQVAGAAADRARGLRALLGLWLRPPGRVLVPEGEPVLRDGERALQDLVYRHDPAACLLRPEELVWQDPRGKGTRFERRSGECSRPLGLRVLDFEVTVVPPGRENTLLHRHDGLEEAFVVLQGEGVLVTESGAFPIRTGDVLGFPPRYQVAHAFRNTGAGDLRLLALGAFAEPAEAVGLAEYPESGKQFQWVPGKFRRFYLPQEVNVDYWEGERIDLREDELPPPGKGR